MRYINQTILGSLRKLSDPRGTRKPDYWIMYSWPETDSIYPFISIRQGTFSPAPVGLGMDAGTMKTLQTETFTGDGSKRGFVLENPATSIISVEVADTDPDYEYTTPDYWIYNSDTGAIVFDSSAVPDAGKQITVSYMHDPDMKERFGYRFEIPYTITIQVKKNTQGKDDENFEIDSYKYANGRLLDYLAEQVLERVTTDYDWFRKRQVQVTLTNMTEELYDPETRIFAKQITILARTDFLIEKKELPIAQLKNEYYVEMEL